MTNRSSPLIALCAVLAMSAATPVAAQPAKGLADFAGAWTINLDRSIMERAGPNAVQTRRAGSFTWVFTPEGAGLKMEIYTTYPAPSATKTMAIVVDGRQHGCQMAESCLSTPGDPKEQSYAFTQAGEHMLTRVFEVRGQPVEYNVYTLSKDGRSFVATSWSPETPEYRNVQVFEKRP